MQDEYYQLHKKTVQHPQNCFGTPIWWMWRSMSSFGDKIDEVVQMEKRSSPKGDFNWATELVYSRPFLSQKYRPFSNIFWGEGAAVH